MGETREPAKGSWTVFEGDSHVISLDGALRYDESINREITWPITLRVHRVKDGVMESRDIEIAEDFRVTVHKHQRITLDSI